MGATGWFQPGGHYYNIQGEARDSVGGITEETEKANCLPRADFVPNEPENTEEARRASL